MGKSVFSHFFIIGSGTVINMLISFITTPIITRIVSPTEYGQLSIFNLYTSIALMILCLGMDQSLIRFYFFDDSLEYKKSLLKTCFLPAIIVSIFLGIIFCIMKRYEVLNIEFDFIIVVILVINIIASIWNRFAILLLRVTFQSKKYATCCIMQKATYVSLGIFLAAFYKKEYLLILTISTVISVIVPSIIACVFTLDVWKFKKIRFVKNYREIIKYGIPFIFSMGLTTLFQTIDKFSINHFGTYADVGVYSSAMNLVNIFAVIQTTVNSLWGPMQMEYYVKHPGEKQLFEKGNRMITVIMFFLGINLILFKNILVLFLGEKYRVAAYVIPFLIFNPIMYTISETANIGISVSKKSHLNIIVSLVACFVNFVINICLVPKFGCVGAAISTGLSYIVFWGMRVFFSNQYYYIDYKLWKIILIILITSVYALYNSFHSFDFLCIIGYLICSISLVVLYVDAIKEMIELVKMKFVNLRNIIKIKRRG